MQCAGIAKSTNSRCKRNVTPPRIYCKDCELRHDPTAPFPASRGIGRSSYLPPGEFERGQRLLEQGDPYDLTQEIAVIQTFFTQAQQSLDHGEPYELWGELRDLFANIDRNSRYSDPISKMKFTKGMTSVRSLIEKCEDKERVENEMIKLVKLLSVLQVQQAKMEKLHSEFVPKNKMRMFFAALLNGIYEGLPDEHHQLRLSLARKVKSFYKQCGLSGSELRP